MNLFRKKPQLVSAVQYQPGLEHGGVQFKRGRPFVTTAHDQPVFIEPGDWIIPDGEPGRFYPVKDAIFRATYEPVEPQPAVHLMEGVMPALRTREEVESYFRFEHLPDGPVKDTSRIFHEAALKLFEAVPSVPERTLALRDLWAAKNHAVFAVVEAQNGSA